MECFYTYPTPWWNIVFLYSPNWRKIDQFYVKNNILALLAAGADVMVQNKDGKIPWDYAKNNDDIDETDEYTEND